MLVIAFFSVDGVPQEELSPTCTIRRIDDGEVVVTAAAMGHVGSGFYEYDFTAQDRLKTYTVVCDGGISLPAEQRYATDVIGADNAGIGIDAIKAKTDGLPTSTQARIDQIDSAIAGIPDSSAMAVMLNDVEQNIRGGDETLGTVSGKIQTAAAVIDTILAIESGTWELIDTQLVFRTPGTNVEIARFNLYDAEGEPSASNVYRRERI